MHALNLALFVLALGASALAVLRLSEPGRARPPAPTAHGSASVSDARGRAVPVRRWQRLVSLDLVSDELLALLVEPERILAVSRWAQGPESWRLAGKPRLAGLGDLEALLRLAPDLVLISSFGGDDDRLARLQEAGIVVCDLGPATGYDAFLANVRRVASAIAAPERGERLVAILEARRQALAARAPRPPPRALVLIPIGDEVYGGSVGSSFHDLLRCAGLADAAAGQLREPWPRYTAELVHRLAPELIVTRAGGGRLLERLPGYRELPAIRAQRLVELPEELFDSPGSGILDAAERLQELLRALP
ncbi:MAG: ABC transporter substrate-binding protein [Planctomycetota bacterium]|nr:ABC transporter substrate-binding protein [Planctomycetota bacterium]